MEQLTQASGGRIQPYDYDSSDYWSPRLVGGVVPSWLRRLLRGKRRFWREPNYDEDHQQNNPECYTGATWDDRYYDMSNVARAGARSTNDLSGSIEMPALPSPVKEGSSIAREPPVDALPPVPGKRNRLASVQESK